MEHAALCGIASDEAILAEILPTSLEADLPSGVLYIAPRHPTAAGT
jgi:hypothetical protein